MRLSAPDMPGGGVLAGCPAWLPEPTRRLGRRASTCPATGFPGRIGKPIQPENPDAAEQANRELQPASALEAMPRGHALVRR